ncbi:MAG: hypothetical protein R3B57_02535 [Phycisphaerales bacterium]
MSTDALLTIPLILVGSLLLALVPGAIMWVSSRAYFPPRARIEPLDPDKTKHFLDATRNIGLWADRHGWHWVGAFAFPAGSFAETMMEVWHTPGLDRYLVAFRHKIKPNALFIEFMTLFDDANHLDTLTSREDLMFPDLPGRFIQVFPNETSLDNLWASHERGEQWAASTHALRPRPYCQDFETMWSQGAPRVIRGLMSKPLWPLRIWIWYFRQQTLASRGVWQRRGLRPAMRLQQPNA